MNRLISTLVLMTCLFVCGCNTQRVGFNVSTSYNAPITVDEGMIISYPDNELDEIYRIQLGEYWWTQIYEIPISEAYLSELRGRFGPVFTKGITVTTNETIEDLRRMEVEATSAPTQDGADVASSELDRLLDEIGAPRPDEDEETLDPETTQQRHQEIFRGAALEELRENNSTYLMRINQSAYNFANSRCQVLLRVELVDRRTGVILIDNEVYTGRSRTFSPHQSERTNIRDISYLTRQALGQAMAPLVSDVLDAVGAK